MVETKNIDVPTYKAKVAFTPVEVTIAPPQHEDVEQEIESQSKLEGEASFYWDLAKGIPWFKTLKYGLGAKKLSWIWAWPPTTDYRYSVCAAQAGEDAEALAACEEKKEITTVGSPEFFTSLNIGNFEGMAKLSKYDDLTLGLAYGQGWGTEKSYRFGLDFPLAEPKNITLIANYNNYLSTSRNIYLGLESSLTMPKPPFLTSSAETAYDQYGGFPQGLSRVSKDVKFDPKLFVPMSFLGDGHFLGLNPMFEAKAWGDVDNSEIKRSLALSWILADSGFNAFDGVFPRFFHGVDIGVSSGSAVKLDTRGDGEGEDDAGMSIGYTQGDDGTYVEDNYPSTRSITTSGSLFVQVNLGSTDKEFRLGKIPLLRQSDFSVGGNVSVKYERRFGTSETEGVYANGVNFTMSPVTASEPEHVVTASLTFVGRGKTRQ